MNDFESVDKDKVAKETFEKLGRRLLDEKSIYNPALASSKVRLQKYMEKGLVEVQSLSCLLQNVGLDECESGKEEERDTALKEIRELLRPHEELIKEKIAKLPTYFQQQNEHWEGICRDDSENAGHFTNNARIAEAIIARIGLGRIGIIKPLDESEYAEALPWLQRTIKLVTNAEIQNVLKEGRHEHDVKTGTQNLLDFLVNWCPNANISPDDLDFGSEDNKRKIEKLLSEYYREFLGQAPNAPERLQKMTSQIHTALGLVMETDSPTDE